MCACWKQLCAWGTALPLRQTLAADGCCPGLALQGCVPRRAAARRQPPRRGPRALAHRPPPPLAQPRGRAAAQSQPCAAGRQRQGQPRRLAVSLHLSLCLAAAPAARAGRAVGRGAPGAGAGAAAALPQNRPQVSGPGCPACLVAGWGGGVPCEGRLRLCSEQAAAVRARPLGCAACKQVELPPPCWCPPLPAARLRALAAAYGVDWDAAEGEQLALFAEALFARASRHEPLGVRPARARCAASGSRALCRCAALPA